MCHGRRVREEGDKFTSTPAQNYVSPAQIHWFTGIQLSDFTMG